jgi:hypothetical protein
MVLMVFPPRGFNLAFKFLLLFVLILFTTSYLSRNDTVTYTSLNRVTYASDFDQPVRPIWTPSIVDASVEEDEEFLLSTPAIEEDEEDSTSTPWEDEEQKPINFVKEQFVQDFLDNEIDGPMDIQPLKDFCASRDYAPGLIFKCQPVAGGVGNVKNEMLNCLRFAFEAGGKISHVMTINMRLTRYSKWICPP